MVASAGAAPAATGLRRLIGLGLARVRSLLPDRVGAGFDPNFYRAAYADLAQLSPAQLRRHYADHGRPEGRFGDAAALTRSLERDHEPLSPDFDLAVYRLYNPDIAGGGASDFELLTHYFKHGRAEGRTCSAFHPAFYRDLYHPDWPMDAEALEADWRAPREEPRYASLPEMLDAFGFRIGAWVQRLKPTEFRVLNEAWAGAVQTREQALLAFVRDGWTRLAPLSLEQSFDATFYRETHPELEALDDAGLYKDWLLRGFDQGETASVADQLQRLGVELPAYPTAFPWQAYIHRPGAGGDRWSALRHLIATGFDPSAVLMEAPGARALLLALGDAYAKRGDDRSAVTAMQMAQQSAPLPPRTRQHLADAYFRLGVWREALSLYEQVVQAGSPTAWTVANGTQCARALGETVRAFRLLAHSRAQLGGDQLWLKTVRDVIASAFDGQAYLARAFYAQERVAEGHAVLDQAVGACVDRLSELAPLGVAIAPAPGGRVAILANQYLRQCTHYRVEQKAELLEAAQRPYDIFDQNDVAGFLQALPGASAAIFYRVAALPSIVEAIVTARTLGIATYYEIDDLIFDPAFYPAPIETYGGLLSKIDYDGLRFGTPLYRAAMALCDYGLASTQPLAERMAPIVRTGECFVIANGLDSLNEHLLDRPHLTDLGPAPGGAPSGPDEIRIFYGSGTLAHNSDFLELAGPGLLELLAEDARVRLVIVGYLALGEAFEPFESRIERIGFTPDARAYWALLETADINLAVLEPGVISDCKSEIKWLEAAVFAIPSVVTPTAAYRAVLSDGEDVVFASGVEGWRAALRALAQDSALRKRIGAAGRVTARQRFSLQAGAAALEQALAPADAAAATRHGDRTKPRLMVVNVYFPPQTIGGATRVVRDNIDSWIASGAAEAFEIAVATTDHELQPAGRLRVDSYRGLPVFRISTPLEANMDWRPLNPEMGWMFGELLTLWKPDLVHFHAPQRLTASCAQACREAGVPYLVTAHDAWWISDWQFLTDDDGRLQTPGQPLIATSQTGITPARSTARLNRLRAELEGAAAVLAVSQTFAEIYRQAGIEKTVAVPNGLPHLHAVVRRPSPSGRVRLGHLGSMSPHKGYHLIRAALQEGGYRNLQLTIVDHARTDGVEHQMWGSTPVTIVGKVRQTAVHELYAELDVLLAPSIWPESYGLVVREALAAGLWVVASNLGAMGEDVTPGQNGFVIDVSSAEALAAALWEIDSDPARYLEPPQHRPRLRTADDQAADLLEIYRTILAAPRQDRSPPPAPSPSSAAEVERVAG